MARTEEISRIEQILSEDLHVVRIIHDSGWNIPDIDYSCFDDSAPIKPQDVVAILVDYLNKYCIEDDFKDHNERIEWEWRKNEEYREQEGVRPGQKGYINKMASFINSNALGLNAIANVVSNIEMLILCYRGTNPDFKSSGEEIIRRTRELWETVEPRKLKYDLLMNGQKVNYVKGLKQDIYALLKTVAIKQN